MKQNKVMTCAYANFYKVAEFIMYVLSQSLKRTIYCSSVDSKCHAC